MTSCNRKINEKFQGYAVILPIGINGQIFVFEVNNAVIVPTHFQEGIALSRSALEHEDGRNDHGAVFLDDLAVRNELVCVIQLQNLLPADGYWQEQR